MVINEAGEFYDLTLPICFLTSEKHSFGVHTNKSPQSCTHVEQIVLYKAGLLLNIDVAVPFLKSKSIAKNNNNDKESVSKSYVRDSNIA